MARFTKVLVGSGPAVWGVRLTPEEAATAYSDDQVTVTKQDGTTKVVTLAGLVEQKTTPGGALVYADWGIREERKVLGRGRPRRAYAGASLASQTAPYDLAEPSPAVTRASAVVAKAAATAGALGYADALLFAAEYEADEDVWPNLLSRPTLLVGDRAESTLTRE